MPLWLKNLIMLGVFTVWLAYIIVVFAHNQFPPLPAWSVPGATYAVLSDRKIKIGKEGLSVGKEEKEEGEKE